MAVDAYRKAPAAAAYAVMARSMARELLPEELRAAARWAASALGARVGWGQRDRRTLVVRSQPGAGGEDNLLFEAARTYLASRLDPRAMLRLGVTLARARDDAGRATWRRLLFLEPGDSTLDDFEGVRFTWTCVENTTGSGGSGSGGTKKKAKKGGERGAGGDHDFVLELSFDAQHTDVAMDRYVPFIMEAAEEVKQRERALKICFNEGRIWYHMVHHHPATFDTLAMDPALKRSIVADLAAMATTSATISTTSTSLQAARAGAGGGTAGTGSRAGGGRGVGARGTVGAGGHAGAAGTGGGAAARARAPVTAMLAGSYSWGPATKI